MTVAARLAWKTNIARLPVILSTGSNAIQKAVIQKRLDGQKFKIKMPKLFSRGEQRPSFKMASVSNNSGKKKKKTQQKPTCNMEGKKMHLVSKCGTTVA